MNHELRRSLASYVFGALAPEERRELDAHLAGCPGCRDELASYAGLPGLLSRLELTEAAGATLIPPPSLLPSVLAVVESERASRSRQVTRWRLAAAAAAGTAAAAALAGVLTVTGNSSAPVSERPLVAVAGVNSSGSVSMLAKPWGTELRLHLANLPAAEGFAAYAIDAAGVRTLASTWGPTPAGPVEVPGATSLLPPALAGLVIETTDGDKLLSLDP